MKFLFTDRLSVFQIVSVTVVVVSLSFISTSSADTTRDLQNSLHVLNITLGQGVNADGWRQYLKLNELETQAAKGTRADVRQLSQILNRFSANASCNSLPVFNDVRIAIIAHIEQLMRIQSNDLFFEIEGARAGYRQISIAHLKQRRDRAVCDLRKLQQFYATRLNLTDQATVFNDLQLVPLIVFLQNLQFELPPDVSAGKLADELSNLNERKEELEIQLDGLPAIEDPGELDDDLPPGTDEDRLPIDPPAGPQTEDELQDEKIGQTSNDSIRLQQNQLSTEIDRLNAEYQKVKGIRDTIRKQDANRQKERARVWRELTKFNRGFAEVAKRRHDNFFANGHYALSKFALLYFYATDDNLQAEYNEYLDNLALEIPKLHLPNERSASAAVGDILGWLESTDLAPDLVAAVQRRYSLPNLRISISNSLANQLASRPVSDGRPVNEWLFGRYIQGVAYSNGILNIDFIDDPNLARISLHLRGNVNSQTYTKERRITAYASASGFFEARRDVAFNIGGLLVGMPYGTATLASQFHGVDRRLRLIQRIARKQYEKDKFRNEQESTRRLKTRVINQFSQQSDEALGQAKSRFNQALTNSVEIGSYLPQLYLRTTSDRLWAIGHKSSFQLVETGRVANLAAPVPPGSSSVNAQVAVQVHESLVSNYLDPFFNNRTYTNNELAELAEELSGEKPEGLVTDDDSDEDSWSITFAAARPIQFEFDNNAFVVAISGQRFSKGDTKIQAGLIIRLPFKIKRNYGQLILIRDGDALIDYVEPDRKNAKIVAFKSFLETKLNSKDSEQTGLRKGIELPANLIPVDRVARLQQFPVAKSLWLVELRMIGGWLYAGWNRVAPGTRISLPIDTPAIWNEFASPVISAPIVSTQPFSLPNYPAQQFAPVNQIQHYMPTRPALQYRPVYVTPPCNSNYSTPVYGTNYQGRRAPNPRFRIFGSRNPGRHRN